jgi:hypothetical protein
LFFKRRDGDRPLSDTFTADVMDSDAAAQGCEAAREGVTQEMQMKPLHQGQHGASDPDERVLETASRYLAPEDCRLAHLAGTAGTFRKKNVARLKKIPSDLRGIEVHLSNVGDIDS